MKIDEEAQKHIDDCHVIIDLQREEIAELKAMNAAKDAQIMALMKGQKVEYEVA